jgi:uncharacterized membrane protein
MMSIATLLFSSANWLWLAVGATGVALGLLVWSYRVAPPGFIRWPCLGLKALGIAALAVCLLEPLWSGQRARPGANLFAIVADNSQGLQIRDRGEQRSRGEWLRDLLEPQRAPWQATLEGNFDLRRYVFDARLQAAKDFGELTFAGRSTALGSALHALRDRFLGRPLAGVLLLTDGNATDLQGDPNLQGLPPVYPVVVGSQDPIRDIAIQQAVVSQTAFEDAPVSVQANVSAEGYSGASIVAQVLEHSGKKVAEQTLRARKDHDTLAFRFQLKPETAGLCFYRLRVRAEGELKPTGVADKTEEATLANNSTVLVVDRGRGPYRILYVAGRPNWEFKFLNRAAQEDDQLQLVGLIRVARREPKFNFLGRPGETSNPLFRGFGNQTREDAERYDQPVLIRLNTRDELELRAGFPATPEDLYGYHAVLVDDLEAEFFTPDQAALLQRFVSERGGGLLMLGGMECFQQGRYQRTPIGDMLPVYLDRPSEGWPSGPVRLNLTREGWLQPWARLRDTEAAEKSRLQAMPPFLVLNPVQEVKPGASVVATVADAGGRSWPALVTQRFGRGRTAALTIGDLWHWGLHDAEAHHDMDKAWRQLLRWLVTDVPKPVELAIPPSTAPDGAVDLQVRVRDPKFQPLDNAQVTVEVLPVMAEPADGPGTNSIRLPAEAALNEPGLYQASYVPRWTGGYRAAAYVTNSAGAEVGRAEAGWTTDLAAEEFRSLTPNVALLENIARRTGGEVIPANQLEKFSRSLQHRQAPVMEAWTFPLWHTPAMFGLALACFVSEWGLRRWKGLP